MSVMFTDRCGGGGGLLPRQLIAPPRMSLTYGLRTTKKWIRSISSLSRASKPRLLSNLPVCSAAVKGGEMQRRIRTRYIICICRGSKKMGNLQNRTGLDKEGQMRQYLRIFTRGRSRYYSLELFSVFFFFFCSLFSISRPYFSLLRSILFYSLVFFPLPFRKWRTIITWGSVVPVPSF